VTDFNRYALPVAALLMLALVKLWPALRLRARTGCWPVDRAAHRSRTARVMVGLISLLSTLLLVWIGLYAWRGPARLGVTDAPAWLIGAGWAVMALACVLIAWGQAAMGDSWRLGLADPPPPLVVRGPYRLVRHPIYLGWWVFVAGVALATPSVWSLVLAAAFAPVLTAQARLEDRHLHAKLGAQHAEYRSRVGAVVPRWQQRTPKTDHRT
jgi:protein-S-isoprenylcysteine O-methyltransferase Ste14